MTPEGSVGNDQELSKGSQGEEEGEGTFPNSNTHLGASVNKASDLIPVKTQ